MARGPPAEAGLIIVLRAAVKSAALNIEPHIDGPRFRRAGDHARHAPVIAAGRDDHTAADLKRPGERLAGILILRVEIIAAHRIDLELGIKETAVQQPAVEIGDGKTFET